MYDIFQTVFDFSQSSLLNDKSSNRSQKKIENRLAELLKQIEPGFNLAWGPAAFKSEEPSEGAIAWFATDNSSIEFDDGEYRPIVLVGVGSTSDQYEIDHPESFVGQVVDMDEWTSKGLEGLKVLPTPIENEPQLSPGVAYIAYGYAKFLHKIITGTGGLTSHPLLPEIWTILKNHTNARVVFVGHGRGGALASLLAYALVKVGEFEGKSVDKVLTYSTASPSPGNLAFVKQFEHLFQPPGGPLGGFRHWNVNIVNKLDIAACGYSMDSAYTSFILGSIPTIYGSPALETVEGVVSKIEHHAQGLYYPIKASTFESPIPKPDKAPASDGEFRTIVSEQYKAAYIKYILGKDAHVPSTDADEEISD